MVTSNGYPRPAGAPHQVRETDPVLLAAKEGETTWGLRNTSEYLADKDKRNQLEKYQQGWLAVEPLTRFKIGFFSEVGKEVTP